MIAKSVEKLLLEKKEYFLIPAENVVNLHGNNPLGHAVLVLTKVKYSKIPVLDKEDKYLGLIGLPEIMEKMVGESMEKMNLSVLDKFQVADVLDDTVQTITMETALEEILHLLVDTSFLPVVDSNGVFKGIVTRKEMLKAINHMAHELEKRNVVKSRKVRKGAEKLFFMQEK